MENQKLQAAFVAACLGCQVFSTRTRNGPATPMIDRGEIKTHIPAICAAMGIEVSHADVDVLLTPHGVLNESVLPKITQVNRSVLTIAMVSLTIRYTRSGNTGLPSFETVKWIRTHYREIEKQRHNGDCKPHRALVDWYALVNANVFVRVPLPEKIGA